MSRAAASFLQHLRTPLRRPVLPRARQRPADTGVGPGRPQFKGGGRGTKAWIATSAERPPPRNDKRESAGNGEWLTRKFRRWRVAGARVRLWRVAAARVRLWRTKGAKVPAMARATAINTMTSGRRRGNHNMESPEASGALLVFRVRDTAFLRGPVCPLPETPVALVGQAEGEGHTGPDATSFRVTVGTAARL